MFSSSVEYYLNQRTEFKRKLKDPGISEAERVYYKMQERECKVLANSFYGTAPHPCGPLISGHGRQQIAVVNSCVASFYQYCCPVVYGDTDSVMVSVGYRPEDDVEKEVPDANIHCTGEIPNGELEKETLERFSYKAPAAIYDKFERTSARIFRRTYVIDRGNTHHKVVRDLKGTCTKEGYPVYLARVPGSIKVAVENRRMKLQYENSSSIYCHVAKKTYVALTHNTDEKGELSVPVKVRGLSAFKSI